MEQYNEACQELENEDVEAYVHLMERNITRFCKAFITPLQSSDSILNNMCESFNKCVLIPRGKHLIHMLEDIRTSLMEMHYK